MSESIQLTPTTNSGIKNSKLSSLDSSNAESKDDSAGFTAVFAGYVESDPEVTKQQVDENLAQLLNELLPQEHLGAGNTLPQTDDAAMWQALMLMQPLEGQLTNSVSKQIQNISVLDRSGKPMQNMLGKPGQDYSLMNADYFNTSKMQNQEQVTSLAPGFATNNITAQLAATHFTPNTQESIFLSMNESLTPLQGINSNLSQTLAAVGLGTATQAASTQTQMAPLNLGQNAWESNLGSRLQMLVGQNIQTAEIRLDPPELGALDIKIKVANDIATVNISSANSQVRDAIETAIPKLREMFAETGVSLGDVNVKQESFSQQQQSSENEGGLLTDESDMGFIEEPVAVLRKNISDSLLDLYA